MDVKQILEKIRSAKKPKEDFYFALQIEENLVKSAVWAIKDGQTKIICFGEKKEWQNEESLLEAVDLSLTSANQRFFIGQESKDLSKVVLGLPFGWVEQDRILPERFKLIKNISQKLSLKPIGFVMTVEAIVHRLKTTEGIPPTAILIKIEKEKIMVSLINLGKVMGVQLIGRSDNFVADLVEGLSRFRNESPFPARIILYGEEEGEAEGIRQEIINYSWTSKENQGISFLHLPRVEILPNDFDIRALVLAGGKEIGGVEAKEVDLAGFVKEQDITAEPAQPTESAQPLTPEASQPEPMPPPQPHYRFNFFIKLKNAIHLPKFRINFGGHSALVIRILFGFLLIATIFFGLYTYLPKAKVTLFIKPQIQDKDFVIKFDPSLNLPDRGQLSLPAELAQITLEIEKATSTTGTKLIGESAKGEVKIYNSTSSQKIFPPGTIITSSSGIKFTLDDEARIASQSSAAEMSPSVTVKITAKEIGTEGNLAAGAEFTVANFAKSDYVAKNQSAFTGGVSRKVQAVAKKDQEDLLKEATTELQSQAKEKLTLELGANKLVEESLKSQIIEKNFSHKVDEEAEELKLNLKIKFSGLSFNESEFKELVKEEVEKSIPEGYEYKSEESKIDFSLKEINKDGVATFSTHFKVYLVPKLDLEAIKKNLAGKRSSIGEAYLNSLPQIDFFEAKISPRLPSWLVIFPRLVKNIKLEVVAK